MKGTRFLLNLVLLSVLLGLHHSCAAGHCGGGGSGDDATADHCHCSICGL